MELFLDRCSTALRVLRSGCCSICAVTTATSCSCSVFVNFIPSISAATCLHGVAFIATHIRSVTLLEHKHYTVPGLGRHIMAGSTLAFGQLLMSLNANGTSVFQICLVAHNGQVQWLHGV
jgi:hypothetical protein